MYSPILAVFFILCTASRIWSSEISDYAGFTPATGVTYNELPALTLEQHVENVRQGFGSINKVPKSLRRLVLRRLGISHLVATAARNPGYREKIKEFLRNETVLDLSQEPCITAERLQEWATLCPNVTHLTINRTIINSESATLIDDSLLTVIAKSFRRLKGLSLPGNAITAQGLSVLATNFYQLEELDLSNNLIMLDADLVTLLFRLPFLTTLNLQRNRPLRSEKYLKIKRLLNGWQNSSENRSILL